ncbi:MAG: ATP-binding cassette domain-containing protein, partial [Bacillales bacterium]|nr:ATP-binding cassette domain-containing protein [Bacillales bacterium]
MIQIRNLSKIYKSKYKETKALDNINLDFPEKGMFFIVGKSGSGKSTLLNLLGGLDSPTSGNIYLNGVANNSLSKNSFAGYRNHVIGFVFQEFNLIDTYTITDNIALALTLQSKGNDNNTIDDVLRMVGLENIAHKKPNEISGGQKQRVAIARALIKNPQ